MIRYVTLKAKLFFLLCFVAYFDYVNVFTRNSKFGIFKIGVNEAVFDLNDGENHMKMLKMIFLSPLNKPNEIKNQFPVPK